MRTSMATMTLDAATRAPAEARAFAQSTLAAWHLDDGAGYVTLLVSELVTNVAQHSPSGGRLTLLFTPSTHLRVEVEDHSTTAITPRDPRPDEPSGRGLLIVARVARAWGIRDLVGGHVVWFEIDLSRAPEV